MPPARSSGAWSTRRRSSCSATPSSTSTHARVRRGRSSPRAQTRRRKPPRTSRRPRSATAWRQSATGSSETARQRAEQASVEQSSRRNTELFSGLGSVVGVLLGGKADTRTIARAGRALGGAANRRGMSTRASERKEHAEEKAELAETDLAELEQELLDEVAEIDEKWAAKADAVETVPIRLEAGDVRVVETTLVWVPTA